MSCESLIKDSRSQQRLTISFSANVRHICVVYKHLLQSTSASKIPTFYEYFGLPYAKLAGLPDDDKRWEILSALERHPSLAHAPGGEDAETYMNEDFELGRSRPGKGARSRLDDHEDTKLTLTRKSRASGSSEGPPCVPSRT